MKHIFKFENYIKENKLNETTEFDSLILGQTVNDIKDLINGLKYEDLHDLNAKKIVAIDKYHNGDDNKYGYSIGRIQGSSPRGVLIGTFDIQKWRNLSSEDKERLDGILIEIGKVEYIFWFTFPNF